MDFFGIWATILSISGAFFVGRKLRLGFHLWLISNGIWIAWSVYYSIWEQLPMWVAFMLTTIYGEWNWRK
jgi:hypothetical protein